VHVASLPTARDEIENSYDRDEQQNAAKQDEHIPHVLGHGLASRISATAQPTSAIHTAAGIGISLAHSFLGSAARAVGDRCGEFGDRRSTSTSSGGAGWSANSIRRAQRRRVNGAKALFRTGAVRGTASMYDVTPDGKRFLVNTVPESARAAPLTVVVNWIAPPTQ
jgi:hypothetical protein